METSDGVKMEVCDDDGDMDINVIDLTECCDDDKEEEEIFAQAERDMDEDAVAVHKHKLVA